VHLAKRFNGLGSHRFVGIAPNYLSEEIERAIRRLRIAEFFDSGIPTHESQEWFGHSPRHPRIVHSDR
jgi:hypothetical protein